MNNFADITSSARGYLIRRLPFLLLLVIGMGLALFAITSIMPLLTKHSGLVSQVTDGKQALDNRAAQESQKDDATVLQARIDSAQAQLEQAGSVFWTEVQMNAIQNRLYAYAQTSGVKIANVQTQVQAGQSAPAPSGAATPVDPYTVQGLRLQVNGTFTQLLNFVTRIRELSAPTVNIANVNIAQNSGQGAGQATLTMTLLVHTSPYASGEVFGSLPQMRTPSPIPPTATPITPTATFTPTMTPSPTLTPLPFTQTFTPSPTATITLTPTIAPGEPCSDQSSQTMRPLLFSFVQTGTGSCQTQVWSLSLDRSTEYIIDVVRHSGNGLFKLELYDSSNKVVTTSQSSIDGRGLIVTQSAAGNYTVHLVPLSATGDWAYSIALWRGFPSLSFAFTQSSYSSHSSSGNRANVTTWTYAVNGDQSFKLEVTRTDGKLEYGLSVLDASKKEITSSKSSNGNVSLSLTESSGTYYVEITALDNTTGSYRISLAP